MKKQSISDDIYIKIKGSILDRRYNPGEHLVEAELIKDYNCSRATLRGVLRRLSDDGLTEHIPNKGILVRKLSLKEMLDIQLVLQALEPLAARLAAQVQSVQGIEQMKKILHDYKESLEQNNFGQLNQLAVKFKLCIAESSDNVHLFKTIEQYYSMLLTNIGPSFDGNQFSTEDFLQLYQLYNEILSSIELGKPEIASNLLYRHLELGIEKIKRTPSKFPFSDLTIK